MVEKQLARLELITPASFQEYRKTVAPLASASWPEFMLHDPVTDEHWSALYERFPEYQFGLLDVEKHQAAAMGNSLPLRWENSMDALPERGFDWALQQAVEDHQAGRVPNIQCAIQVAIHPAYRGQGLSVRMVEAMRDVGRSKGLSQLIAPVRPNQKALYPLCDIDHYVRWTNAEGLPFDAWLRVHARMGARIVRVCHESMLIAGRIEEWESWTGLSFPESGSYFIPEALTPVEMDIQADSGVYVEPNVWMLHELA